MPRLTARFRVFYLSPGTVKQTQDLDVWTPVFGEHLTHPNGDKFVVTERTIHTPKPSTDGMWKVTWTETLVKP